MRKRGLQIAGKDNRASVRHCTITENVYGIYFELADADGVPQPTLEYNAIEKNSGYELYIKCSLYNLSRWKIKARKNWWGFTNINTIAERIFDYSDNPISPAVDFSEYLDKAGGSPTGGEVMSGVPGNEHDMVGRGESVSDRGSGGGG